MERSSTNEKQRLKWSHWAIAIPLGACLSYFFPVWSQSTFSPQSGASPSRKPSVDRVNLSQAPNAQNSAIADVAVDGNATAAYWALVVDRMGEPDAPEQEQLRNRAVIEEWLGRWKANLAIVGQAPTANVDPDLVAMVQRIIPKQEAVISEFGRLYASIDSIEPTKISKEESLRRLIAIVNRDQKIVDPELAAKWQPFLEAWAALYQEWQAIDDMRTHLIQTYPEYIFVDLTD